MPTNTAKSVPGTPEIWVPISIVARLFGYRDSQYFREVAASKFQLPVSKRGSRWFAKKTDVESTARRLIEATNLAYGPEYLAKVAKEA